MGLVSNRWRGDRSRLSAPARQDVCDDERAAGVPYLHMDTSDWWVSDVHSPAYSTHQRCAPDGGSAFFPHVTIPVGTLVSVMR